MYVSLVGMAGFLGAMGWQAPKAIGRHLWQSGLGAIALLLIISTARAHDPVEASLQLAHFLPYFLLWAALVTCFNRTAPGWLRLRQWSWILVLGAFPLGAIALVEYSLKRLPGEPLAQLLAQVPPLDWLYTGVVADPRAYSVFNSPNTFAHYTVAMMALIVGLLLALEGQSGATNRRDRALLVGTLALLLVGLYCSGSRNGYLVALLVLGMGLYLLRRNPWMRWIGLGGLGAIAASSAILGVGGRAPSWAWVTQDPRVYVWRLALRLTAQNPWWGNGLGSYKFLYDGSVPGYDGIPHAHNLWLSLAAEAGIPVTLGLTAVVGIMCFRGARAIAQLPPQSPQRGIAVGYGLCFLTMVVFALFDVTLFDARLNVLAWVCLAVLGVLPHWHQPPTSSSNGEG